MVTLFIHCPLVSSSDLAIKSLNLLDENEEVKMVYRYLNGKPFIIRTVYQKFKMSITYLMPWSKVCERCN